jgi:hypothetical protein
MQRTARLICSSRHEIPALKLSLELHIYAKISPSPRGMWHVLSTVSRSRRTFCRSRHTNQASARWRNYLVHTSIALRILDTPHRMNRSYSKPTSYSINVLKYGRRLTSYHQTTVVWWTGTLIFSCQRGHYVDFSSSHP